MRLDGKIACITGAARGLGLAMALKFKSEGATVIGIDMEETQIDGIDMRVVNVTNTNEVQTFYDDIIQTYGRVDILVNNAGITRDAMTHKMTDDQFSHRCELKRGIQFNPFIWSFNDSK